MEIILFIVIFYLVYNAITKSNSSVPSNSNSTGVQKTSNYETTINITDYTSYMNALRRQYEQDGDSILQDTNIQAFINKYDLNKRHLINSDDVKQDMLSIINEIKKEKADWEKNYQTYLKALKQYYLQYGEEAFNPSKIHDFIDSNQLESKFGFKFRDVVNNLLNIEAQAKKTTSTPTVQAQGKQNQEQSMKNTQSNTSFHDYEEEFRNTGKYAKAGVAHDLKRHIIEGGGFWYAGDVVRHLGGKNNVIQTYYNRIESAFIHEGREEAANVAAEAAEYARQKGDMLQFWGFLLEEALCTDNLTRIVNISINVCDYCIVQGKAIPPKWYYENGLTICDVHYLALKITDNSRTRDNFTAFLDTILFLIDADKKFKYYDRLEEDFYYLGLLTGHMDRFKKANITSVEMNQFKNEFINMIKEESSDYNALVRRWEKEGISFE